MQDLKITLVQTDISWENPAENIHRTDEKLSSMEEIPDLVVLPEMFSTGFTMDVEKCAEGMDGPSVGFLKKKSAELRCVVTGSVLIKENNRFFNRMIWASPDGKIDHYDKRHLFSMGGEHLKMTAGKSRKVLDLKGWRINLQVCYDLRFPVWCRNSFKDGGYGYDAMVFIANWPSVRRDAYLSLLPARAIENISYVIWVNRTGKDGKGIDHSGDSRVIDPKGNIAGKANEHIECLLTVELSHSVLTETRKGFRVGPDWDKFEIRD